MEAWYRSFVIYLLQSVLIQSNNYTIWIKSFSSFLCIFIFSPFQTFHFVLKHQFIQLACFASSAHTWRALPDAAAPWPASPAHTWRVMSDAAAPCFACPQTPACWSCSPVRAEVTTPAGTLTRRPMSAKHSPSAAVKATTTTSSRRASACSAA